MTLPIFRTRTFILLLGVFLFMGVGVALWASWPIDNGPPAPQEVAPAAPVKWLEARQFFVEEWTEILGATQPLPDRAARITAPVEGRVVSVLKNGSDKSVVEGQRLNKGDVIVQLDANLVKANRAKVEATQEELQHLTKQAEFALKLAEIDVKRLGELDKTSAAYVKLPLVSRIDIDKANLALQDAQSKLQAAKARELTGQKEIQALNEQVQLFTLASPIDGRLGRLLVVQGQTLSVGTLIADIFDIADKIDVLCFVPPRVANRLKLGQTARIGSIDGQSSGDPNVDGKVEFIADQAEIDTGNFAVKIRFPNSVLGLRANTTLQVRVLTTPGKACLTLPESAVFEDQFPPAVVVVDDYKVIKDKDGKEVETGTARKLRVKLGIRDRNLRLVEIIGLEDPENKWTGSIEEAKFVIERGRGLRTGDPIRLEVED